MFSLALSLESLTYYYFIVTFFLFLRKNNTPLHLILSLQQCHVPHVFYVVFSVSSWYKTDNIYSFIIISFKTTNTVHVLNSLCCIIF